MKEKLKKIFTCKELWSFIFEILCAIILVLAGYFIGFANGLLIEDDIRDNMIVEINDLINEDKNEKLNIDIEKKDLKTEQYELIAIPYGANNTDSIVFDVGYVVEQCKIYYNDIVTSNIIPRGSYAYLCSDLSFYNNLAYGKIFAFYSNYNGNYEFRVFLIYGNTYSISNGSITINDAYLAPIICTISSTGVTDISNNFFGSYYINSYFNTFNSKSFGTYNLQFFDLFEIGAYLLPNITDAYNQGINVGYQSGVIEGVAEYKTSQDYKDELKEEYDKGIDDGYDIGYQARQDSVEDSEQTINFIWSILEKSITSVLNVLSFEILPSIPLYVCIVVPILLCILLWVIKVGAS